MRSPRILVFDCGAAHIACGLFCAGTDGRLRLEQYAHESFVVDPTDEGRWAYVLGQTLESILARDKFPVSDCVITVPGHLALTKLVKTPSVDKDKRSRIVQFEASQNIPYPLDEVAWGQLEVNDDGVDLEFMLSAAKLDAMESLCSAVERAGLRVTRCETTSLALWRAHDWCHDGNTSPVLLVDIGARSTQLMFIGPNTMYMRTLSIGGNTVTQTLAGRLQVDFSTAEQIKLHALTEQNPEQVDAITRAAVAQSTAEFTDRLQLEIMRSRLSYLRQSGSTAPDKILLNGMGAGLKGLAPLLTEKLGLPVEPFAALAHLDLSERARLDGAEIATDQLVGLIGMATPILRRDAAFLDLLPPTRSEAQAWRRRQPWWLMATVLLVLSLGPPILYYNTATSRLQRQVNAIEELAAPMRQLEVKNASNLARLQVLEEQIDAIQGLVASRTNWVGFLADLQMRLSDVGDVWLERMQVITETELRFSSDAKPTPLRLELEGRLLDAENPLANASSGSYARVKTLFGSLTDSPFVQAVADERFDNRQPGILRFEFTLIMNPENPL